MGDAHARPIRTLDLDRDVREADLIALVKVSSTTFQKKGWFQPQWKGRRKPTPAKTGYRVDFHEVQGTVVHPLKNAGKTGASLSFRHRRGPADGSIVPNGFMGYEFKPGVTYLLVLRKETDGVLAVAAAEDFFYATYPETMLASLPARPAQESDLRHVLRLLLARFDHGERPDEVGVSSLDLVISSRVGKALMGSPTRRAHVVKRLSLIVDRDLGTSQHFGALRMLKELGTPVSSETIMGWILDPRAAHHVRMNLVGMLSYGGGAAEQIAALDRIIKECADEEIAKTAARQRTYARDLLKREQEAERRIRESEQR